MSNEKSPSNNILIDVECRKNEAYFKQSCKHWSEEKLVEGNPWGKSTHKTADLVLDEHNGYIILDESSEAIIQFDDFGDLSEVEMFEDVLEYFYNLARKHSSIPSLSCEKKIYMIDYLREHLNDFTDDETSEIKKYLEKKINKFILILGGENFHYCYVLIVLKWRK